MVSGYSRRLRYIHASGPQLRTPSQWRRDTKHAPHRPRLHEICERIIRGCIENRLHCRIHQCWVSHGCEPISVSVILGSSALFPLSEHSQAHHSPCYVSITASVHFSRLPPFNRWSTGGSFFHRNNGRIHSNLFTFRRTIPVLSLQPICSSYGGRLV